MHEPGELSAASPDRLLEYIRRQSSARSVVEHCQPTIMREYTSMMKAT
jgi:hypothetical protein